LGLSYQDEMKPISSTGVTSQCQFHSFNQFHSTHFLLTFYWKIDQISMQHKSWAEGQICEKYLIFSLRRFDKSI